MMIQFDSDLVQQFAKRSDKSDLALWFANIENKADRSSSISLQIGVKHFGNHGTKVINHCDLDVKLNIS